MATRFYFPGAETVAGLTPATDASWSSTTGFLRRLMIRAKYASPSAIAVGSTISWANTAGTKALDRQYISPPLASQTISGTVSIMASVREFATSDNADQAICSVRVIDSSGTVVATLLSHGLQTGATTSEFISKASCRSTVFANGATLSSYSCSAGDRIIVEMGYSNSTAGTSPQAATKWGENATDATLGDTTTTANRAAWIEFSANLTFAGPTVTSVSTNNGGVGGGNSVTVTGTNFYNGSTTVAFGSNNATSVVVTSSTTLTCVVPASSGGASGAVNVTVTNGDGTSGSLTNGYTYNPPGPIETVFLGAGGSQIVLYENYSAGSYTDTMGVGSAFTQSTVGDRPAVDRSLAPSRKTMMYFDNGDWVGGHSPAGGVIPTGSFPTWSGTKWVVEHFIVYLPASPDNVSEQRIIDYNGLEYWLRNLNGSGIVYRSGANANSTMSGATVHFVTMEHNVASGVSTMTIDGVAQTDTGTNNSSTRTHLIGDKAIGHQIDNTLDQFLGHFGCYGIGYGTTWTSTERAALYQAMQDWYNVATVDIPPPVSVLGSRLKRFYHGFSNSTRTWTDDIIFDNATQSTANLTPAEHTLASGYVIPNFDGNPTAALVDFLSGPPITGLATYGSTGYYLWCALLRCDALGADGESIIMRTNGTGTAQVIIENDGRLAVHGGAGGLARSNSVIAGDGLIHTVIVMADAASGTLQMWIDGTLQTESGTGSDWGKEWKAIDQEIGARANLSGDYRYDGLIGAMGFAYDASSFSGDISDLHDALVEYNLGPAPSGEISGTTTLGITASATLTGNGALSGSATLGLTATGTMAAGGVSGSTTLGLTASGTLTASGALSGSTTLGLTASGTCLRFETVGLILGARTKRHFGSLASASQWSDNFGAANAVQATSARQPTIGSLGDGFPSVSFSPGGSFGTNADFYSVAPAGASATPQYTLMCGVIQVDPAFNYNAGEGVAIFNIGAAAQLYIFPAIDFTLRLAGWGAQSFAWDGTAINDGLPHTWVAEFDSVNHTCTLWVDGATDSNTQVLSPTGSVDLSLETILIGAGNTSGGGPYEGILSDVAIAQDTSSFSGDVAALHAALSAHFVSGAITGTATFALTASGTATGSGALTGSTTLGLTGSGTLTAEGSLSGSTTLGLTASGTSTAVGALSGSASLGLTGSGTLTATGALSGTATLGLTSNGTATGSGALSGSASLGLTAAATLNVYVPISGTSTLGLTATGSILGAAPVSGSGTLGLTAAATLLGIAPISGSANLGLTAAGTLNIFVPISGTTTLGLTGSGNLLGLAPISGTTTLGLTSQGTLSAATSLSGTANLELTTTGTLTGAGELQGSATFGWLTAAAADGNTALQGTATLGLTATGALLGFAAISGTAALGLVSNATLVGIVPISATTSLGLTAAGSLLGAGALSGSATLGLTSQGTMNGGVPVSGTASFGLTAAGTLAATGALVGSAALQLTSAGTILGHAPISATSTLGLSTTGTLVGIVPISGTTTLGLTTAGILLGAGVLQGTATLGLTAAATLNVFVPISGTASFSLGATGTTLGTGALSGSASLGLTPVGTLSAVAAISGTASFDLTAAGALNGGQLVNGSASFGLTAAAATLLGAGALSGAAALGLTSQGTLNLFVPISGTTTLELSAQGALGSIVAISGSTSLGLTASATIRGLAPISATSTLGLTAAATLLGKGALQGTTTLGLTPSGTLAAKGELSGTASLGLTVVGAVSGKSALSGLATLGLTASASLEGKGALQGTTTLGLSSQGTLVGIVQTSGSTTFGLTATGDIEGLIGYDFISGSTTLELEASGALTGAGALQGTTTIGLNTTGTLRGNTSIAGAATFNLGAVGTLLAAAAISGTSTFGLTSSATLQAKGALQGTTACGLNATAALGGFGALQGSTAFELTAEGEIIGYGVGDLQGATSLGLSALATLVGRTALQGEASVDLTAAVATLVGLGALQGDAPLSLDALAVLTGAGALVGDASFGLSAMQQLPVSHIFGDAGLSLSASAALGGFAFATGNASIQMLAAGGALQAVGRMVGNCSFRVIADGAMNLVIPPYPPTPGQPVFPSGSLCNGDTSNNAWVEDGVCMLDMMSTSQVVYVIQHNPKARQDLKRVTTDPELLELVADVPPLDPVEEEDRLMKNFNESSSPYYTQFRGNMNNTGGSSTGPAVAIPNPPPPPPPVFPPGSMCNGDTSNNLWVEGGVCMLDQMSTSQVVYVLQHNPQAREDLKRVTTNPELLELEAEVPPLDSVEEEDRLMNTFNNS